MLEIMPKELSDAPKKMKLDGDKVKKIAAGKFHFPSWENTLVSFHRTYWDKLSVAEIASFLDKIAQYQLETHTRATTYRILRRDSKSP